MIASCSKMNVGMKRIYLDVCCLNRPFDDQEQDRGFCDVAHFYDCMAILRQVVALF